MRKRENLRQQDVDSREQTAGKRIKMRSDRKLEVGQELVNVGLTMYSYSKEQGDQIYKLCLK